MSKKIAELAPEQWAEIYAFREEALASALTPGPADIERARPVFDAMCDAVGERRRPVLRFSSPLVAILAMPFIVMAFSDSGEKVEPLLHSQIDNHLRKHLFGQIGNRLHEQVGSQIGIQIGNRIGSHLLGQLLNQIGNRIGIQLLGQIDSQLRDQIDNHLFSQLGSHVFRNPLRNQLHNRLREQLRDQLSGQIDSDLDMQVGSHVASRLFGQIDSQLRDQLTDQIGSQLRYAISQRRFGHCEMSWIAYWQAAALAGVKYEAGCAEMLGWWRTIADTCGWWWPLEKCIVVADRPQTRWDDQRRLHCETGPAIDFADGCEVYSWHGVAVPKQWIAEKAITPEQALTWDNMEQRRAACEILGWATIIDRLDGKTIDKDSDPRIGELIRVTLPDIGKEQFLRVRCGTGRDFALPVPPNMKTALEANAWTYGLDGDVLRQLEVRT